MFLAQGQDTVPSARLEPATPQSQVEHSTTEPLIFSTADDKAVNVSGQRQ